MAIAAIYLPADKIDLTKFLKVTESDKTLFRSATYFNVAIGSDIVQFNVMPKSEVSEHLIGLQGYINTLQEPEGKKLCARTAAKATQTVLGLVTEREFSDNEKIYSTLFEIAGFYKQGFVFVFDSLFLPGRVVVGPASKYYSDRSSEHPN
jgi:hypothetical protein